MNRRSENRHAASVGVPRTRGDEPINGMLLHEPDKRSPHARG